MSYPYRVRVSKAVERTVSSRDEVKRKLKVDPILSDEEMQDIAREALLKRGFEEGDDGRLRRVGDDGIQEEVDLETMEVTISLEQSEEIVKEKTLEVLGDSHTREGMAAAEEKTRSEAEARLEKTLAITDDEIKEKEEQLSREIAEKLEAGDEARRRELMEVVAEVQAESLKKKAASLGNVMSVEESTNGGEFELTIKISE